MAVLLGFVAFAVDMGIMLLEKRELQTAVDAAAIAGAAEVYGDWQTAAQTDAKQNGVDHNSPGTTVAVHDGPSSGPQVGNKNYVEVIATRSTNTFFMNVFEELANHTGLGSMTVSARAVAGALPSPYCIYTLSSSPPGGMGISLANDASISASNCGILDNATGSQALFVQGGNVTARTIGVVGGEGGGGGTYAPAPTTGINPVGDPLSFLTPPSNPGGCINLGLFGGSPPPFPPGCYSGLTIGGNVNVAFLPGTYYITGPVNITTTGTVSGSGVTFYFSPTGSFMQGGPPYSTLNLSAPTSGPYSGILFYQDPSNTGTMTLAGNSGTMSGVLYLPAAQLNLVGPSSSFNISVVAGSLSATGNYVFTLTPYLSPSGTTPLVVPVLTE